MKFKKISELDYVDSLLIIVAAVMLLHTMLGIVLKGISLFRLVYLVIPIIFITSAFKKQE